jgi:AraC-like DNA-binding protein
LKLNNQDHLALRLARLKAPEELALHQEGLTFVFARGGVGKYVSKNSTHRLAAGEILIVNGSSLGCLSPADKGEFIFWTFSVCFEHLLPLFGSSEISLLHNLTEGFKTGKIYPASSPMAVEGHRLIGVVPSQYNLDHRGQIIRIAASILSAEFKEAQGQRSSFARPEEHMVQVFEKLSASELINLSVGELAERFNCSRRHLNRLFHQHFGVSVASLRMEMRLLKAISLLRDPSAKIINVAEQCGFNHLGLFNTCFKRRFGASPGQWRKSTLQPQPAPKAAKAKPTLACPLQSNGLCPMSHPVESGAKAVASTLTAKIAGGGEILDNLKSKGVIYGPSSGGAGSRHPLSGPTS